MDDLISRQAALKICRKYWHPTFNQIMEEIEQLPSAQRTGKWIPKEIMVHNYYVITGFKCSVCGEDALDDDAEPMTDYCPHCGARMRDE